MASLNKKDFIVLLPVLGLFLPLDLFALSMVVAIIGIIIQKKMLVRIFKTNHIFILLLFCLYMLVISLIKQNYLSLATTFILLVIIIYYGYLLQVMNKKYFHQIINILAFGGILSFILSFFNIGLGLFTYFSSGFNMTFANDFNMGSKLQATFINPNYYGYICSCLILLFVYLKVYKYKINKWLYLSLLVNVVALVMTKSFTSIISLVCAIILLLCFKNFKIFIGSISLTLAGIVGIKWIYPYLNKVNSIISDMAGRLYIWNNGQQLIQQEGFIIGSGFFGYLHNFAKYGLFQQIHTHNLYIEALISLGLIGSIILVIYFVIFLNEQLKLYFQGKSTMGILSLLLIVMTLISGLFDVVIVSPHTFLLLFILMSFTKVDYDEI
ncbi:MAG: O-antigen ligase family protein [Erysipelotrichaceae bacterium]